MARRGYPAEFRRRARELVAAGKTVAEVARLLEVSDQSIYTLRRQELIDRAEHYVYALTDYREVDRAIALARAAST
jgi:transposase-like protein